jgi:hypothetical protein
MLLSQQWDENERVGCQFDGFAFLKKFFLLICEKSVFKKSNQIKYMHGFTVFIIFYIFSVFSRFYNCLEIFRLFFCIYSAVLNFSGLLSFL